MENTLEATLELKKFLNRLQMILKNETVFALGSFRLYNKDRIDDLVCCIEGSFPENYKTLIKNKVARKLESYQIYTQLSITLKQKFPLMSSMYKINKEAADALINGFAAKIDADIKFITNNEGDIR